MIKASNLCSGLTAGIVIIRGIDVKPSIEKQRKELEETVKNHADILTSSEKSDSVRNMLRLGGFKPSGRNKPANEYLLKAAREGNFPFINNAVDVINLLSLQWKVPISLLDLDVLGDCIEIRYGNKDESFVFNKSGQVLDISGLICVCGSGKPLGTPVKDSMAGKITDDSKNVVVVIYVPSKISDKLEADVYCRMIAKKMREYANAEETAAFVI